MAEYSVFDKLVTRLSTSERKDMLERIASAVKPFEGEPDSTTEDHSVDLDNEYQRLGLLERLIVAIVALFTGRDKLSVVEGRLLREVRRRAASATSNFDASRDLLRPSALEGFRSLANAARHFSGPLSRVMGRERAPFVAFLAGLHAPEVQQRLLTDADPYEIAEKAPELPTPDVRRRATLAVEEILVILPPQIRHLIYKDVRTLHHLMALSSFSFERITSEFTPTTGGDAIAVPLSRIADELGKLAGILKGLRPGPSALLLQAVSLYQDQDRLEETDERVEGLLQHDVDAARDAFGAIVDFAARYPIADLVRLAHSNIHWRAVPLSGGEDWFAVWKSFWKERVEHRFRTFAFKRQVENLLSDARRTLQMSSVEAFPGYPPSGLEHPAKHGLSLGVMRSILMELYAKNFKGPLTVLHDNGEFYKSDNRTEFDDVLRELEQLHTEIANLEVRLRPTGDLGMNWTKATSDTLSVEDAAERQKALANQLDADASALLRRAINTFRTLGELLQGVLYGAVGGRYDSVSNLGRLGGKESKEFIRTLESIHVRIKASGELLAELINAESLQRA